MGQPRARGVALALLIVTAIGALPTSCAKHKNVALPGIDSNTLTTAMESGDAGVLRKWATLLAEAEEYKAIPVLIGAIDADNSLETVYSIGHFGLWLQTDVEYRFYHDGAWWRRWWDENKSRFPEEAQAVPVPELRKTSYGRKYEAFPADMDTLQGKLTYMPALLKLSPRAPEFVVVRLWAEDVARQNHPHAIPYLIGLIESADPVCARDVCQRALSKLAAVQLTDRQQLEGAWWRQWWKENLSSYPSDIQAIEIPDFRSPLTFNWTERTQEEERQAALADVADVPALDLKVGGDMKMRYFLIGPRSGSAAPENGYKLLVVVPGGDGGDGFHPFVKRIFKRACGDDYLVAQLVAPKWRFAQQSIWPTRGNPVEGQRFSTEDFVEAVISDVAGRHPLDGRCIFTLSWSSGGPAGYAVALQEKAVVTGSYVAMSVYRPEWHPPVTGAPGRVFLIEHSPEDRTCPYGDAQRAERELSEAGAAVRLVTYEGGHGWHGRIYDRVRENLSWLVGQTAGRAD